MAIVGDIVPPRERGRYQGLFGAVFGATSVLGPLLGGFFTEQLDWRWVFYINLPIGALALIVIAAGPAHPGHTHRHKIDYLGMFLIASVATCLVLVTSLGGTTWAWMSRRDLRAARAGRRPALVLRGRGAQGAGTSPSTQPVHRPHLHCSCAAISFVIGFAMFGAHDLSADVPPGRARDLADDVGCAHAAHGGGAAVLRDRFRGSSSPAPATGRSSPSLGTALTTRRTAPAAPDGRSQLALGDGPVLLRLRPRHRTRCIQVLVLVAQNAVHYRDLGVATSGVTFFRSVGASVGVAVFGAVYAARLGDKLADALRGQRLPGGVSPASLERDPHSVNRLPPTARRGVLEAYSSSITDVFLYAAPLAFVAFVLTWLLREQKLRRSVQVPDESETLGPGPVERSSADEVSRALSRLSTHEGRRDLYARIAHTAGLDLTPAATWMMLRVHNDGPVEPARLADSGTIPRRVIAEGARQLEEEGLATREGLSLVATARGEQAARALSDARQELLTDLLGDWWTPERPTELAELVRQLNEEAGPAEPPRAA